MQFKTSLILLLLSSNLFALNSDRQKPYHFSSNQATYLKHSRHTVLSGNAIITQGSSELTGDTITLIQNSQTHKLEQVIAKGQRATFSTLPDGQTTKMHAKAGTIIFYPTTNKVILKTQARTNQNGQILSSNVLNYDANTNIVTTPSQPSGKKTTIIIPPQLNTQRVKP